VGLSSLWRKLSRNPESALARARQKLDEALPANAAYFPTDEESWACYQRALVATTKCGSDAIASLVLEFDLHFPSGPAPVVEKNGCDPYLIGTIVLASSLDIHLLRKARKILLANDSAPDQNFAAAHRLAIRLGDITDNDNDLQIWQKGRHRKTPGMMGRPETEEDFCEGNFCSG
jgi:hypothetical protein